MFWFILTAFLLIVAYFALVKRYNYWKERGIDQYPIYITLREIIMAFAQRRSIADQMEMIYNGFPGRRYCGVYQLNIPLLVIRDPDLLKQVLVKDFDHFVNHMEFFPSDVEPLLGKNLFALKGDTWRDMRATLSPAFTGSKMRLIFGGITETAKQFVRYFEAQKSGTITLEIKVAFTRFTNDVIASAAFGVSCDSMKDPNNTFYSMGKKVMNFQGFWQNLRFLIVIMAPKIAKMFGITLFDKRIIKYFSEIVIDNIRTREREGIVRQDMIHLLMEARKERSKHAEAADDVRDEEFPLLDDEISEKGEQRRKTLLTDVDIVAQALVFFFAGFDSVAALMSFMAYELAVNTDVQERLQNEIDDVWNQCGGTVTYEALSKMKYMDMVTLETLRKWPGAPATDRICTKPYTIPPLMDDEKPVHLKIGDVISVPTFAIHRDPQFYPDPERFDPERFSSENKSNIVPYTFLTFGAGPRVCIGNRFALMETKLVFFYLLSKFDLVVVDKTVVPLKLAKNPLQLIADGGHWLGLKARKAVGVE